MSLDLSTPLGPRARAYALLADMRRKYAHACAAERHSEASAWLAGEPLTQTILETWIPVLEQLAESLPESLEAPTSPEAVESPIESHPSSEARITELSLHAREGEPFTAEAILQGEPIKRFAASALGWFRAMGGESFVTTELTDAETRERYAITMQRAGGKTPAQALAEARAALAAQTASKARVVREEPTAEQQARGRASALYLFGDMILVWINEGDVYSSCEDLSRGSRLICD